MFKKIFSLLVIMLYVQTVVAQHISVSAPAHVAVGENFRLSYTINSQDVSDFRAGNIPGGLEVIAGPYTSKLSNYQMINGHTSSSSSITYTYTLYAGKSGTYNISPARAHVGGRNIVSKAVRIKVSGSSRNNGSAPRMHGDDAPQMQSAGTRISGKDLFVKVIANKRRVHEQEPILLTYKVYTLVDLTSLEGKMPDLTGFHTQEVKLPMQKNFHVEKFNGRNYRCVTWSQYVMYPQMTGDLKIPSITFKGVVVQQNRSIDPFEAFFNGGSGYVEVRRNVVAPGLDVHVDPLPNKPKGFSGGVGRFTISAQIKNKSVKAGNPLNLRIVISGTGNLKLIKQPQITLPKDFDKYDPKITDKTQLTSNGIEGSMIYDYLIVPRNQGEYTIPSVNLLYYNTETNKYEEAHTSPIAVNVAKGDGNGNTVDNFSKANDILPIKQGDTDLRENGKFFFNTLWYWTLLLAIFAISLLAYVALRHRMIENADVAKMKGRHANRIATKRLKKAYQLMLRSNQEGFYDEILRALWGYVSDKLDIPVEALSKENIAEKLSQRDIKQETIDKFMSALDECEFERYAPGDATGNMNKTYDSAMVAIMDIEDSIRLSGKKRQSAKAVTMVLCMMMLPMSLIATNKQAADQEYQAGNYQKAIYDYEEILKSGVSPEVYYNLGNAYYRSGNIPQSVLAYERALKLTPGDNDIRFNLQFVNGKTIDKISPQSEMFFVAWYYSIVNLFSVDGWAKMSIFSLILAVLSVFAYLFSQRAAVMKAGFFGFSAFAVIFVLCNVFAFQQKRLFENKDYAIVTAPAVDVTKSPSSGSTKSFTLHEGTKVKISDRGMKGWYGIQVADGREGWIRKSTVEEI